MNLTAPSKPRRRLDPTTHHDRLYSAAEAEFLRAVDEHKRLNHRPFPTLSELFGVMRDLGYAKADAAVATVIPAAPIGPRVADLGFDAFPG